MASRDWTPILLAAALGGAVVWLWNTQAVAAKTLTVKVQPGLQTYAANLGQMIALNVDGVWVAENDQAVSGSAPITFQYNGPQVLLMDWTDLQGNPQTTTLTFVNR